MVTVFVSLTFLNIAYATTPTESLQKAVNQLIAIASKADASDEEKRNQLAEIINTEVDFDQVSRRIVLKDWYNATTEQKAQFNKQFSTILVATYADLLKNYNNQKVIFGKEQIKQDKYAIVDTEVVSGNKNIPVRYRLVKDQEQWKIYDFIVEGISIVSTYKSNYQGILRKGGIKLLLEEMIKAKSGDNKE